MLLDDTPAANPETKEWLRSLGEPPQRAPSEEKLKRRRNCTSHRNGTPNWLVTAMDANSRAKDALAAGREPRRRLRSCVANSRSSVRDAGAFRRTMQMVELAIAAGKDEIAQPLLEDVAAAIETTSWMHGKIRSRWPRISTSSCDSARKFRANAQKNKSSLNGSAASTPSRRSTWGDEWLAAQAKLRSPSRCWIGCIDIEPENRMENPLSRAQSVRLLKNSVRRDLEWLLNTRRIADPPDEGMKEVNRSDVRLRAARSLLDQRWQLPETGIDWFARYWQRSTCLNPGLPTCASY